MQNRKDLANATMRMGLRNFRKHLATRGSHPKKSSRSLALDIRSGAAEQQPGLKRLQNNVEVHDVAVSTGPGMNKAVHDLDKFALENR
mmetsp:Transcript_6550/g.14485  ORF Transcript_6550/g.14485 Transcript_6550/m.14485 type:complete len:88 (-) Transcript_6550:2030-2293(-)